METKNRAQANYTQQQPSVSAYQPDTLVVLYKLYSTPKPA